MLSEYEHLQNLGSTCVNKKCSGNSFESGFYLMGVLFLFIILIFLFSEYSTSLRRLDQVVTCKTPKDISALDPKFRS